MRVQLLRHRPHASPERSFGLGRAVFLRTIFLAVAKVAAYAAIVLVARTLPPASAGRFFFVVALGGVLAFVLSLGLGETLTIETAKNEGRAASLLRFSLLLLAGATGATLILLLALAFFDVPIDISPILLAVLFGAGAATHMIAIGILRGSGRVAAAEVWQVAVSVAFLAFMAGAAVAQPQPSGSLVTFVRVGLELGGAALAASLVWRLTGPLRADKESMRRLLQLTLPMWVVGMSWLALQQIDIILLGFIRDTAAVGAYAPIVKIVEIANLALVIVVPYVLAAAARRPRDVEAIHSSAATTTLIVSSPVLVAMWIAPGLVVDLVMGSTPRDVETIARVLVVGYLLNAALGPNWALVAAAGRGRILAVVAGGSLAAGTVVTSVLIARLGLRGAAMGTLVSFSLLAIGNSALLWRIHRIPPIARRTGIALATLVVATGIASAIRPVPTIATTVASTGVVVAAGVVVGGIVRQRSD